MSLIKLVNSKLYLLERKIGMKNELN